MTAGQETPSAGGETAFNSAAATGLGVASPGGFSRAPALLAQPF